MANQSVIGRTRDYQLLLLKLCNRLATPEASSVADGECETLFGHLARTLMNQFAGIGPHERQAAFLMVYDSSDLHLHPVLRQGAGEVGMSFKVPLGGGVAGAAFLQRRIVAWGKDPESDTLIRPVPLPGLEARYVLALPIYHQQQEGDRKGQLDLEPGAVIGVVTLASDAHSSRIEECRGDGGEARKRSQGAQTVAQGVVMDMLGKLTSRSGSSEASSS